MFNCFVIMGAAVKGNSIPSGAMRRRVEGALRLGKEAGDAMFLVTGGVGKHNVSEAAVMRGLLIEAGIPEDLIVAEDQSRTTLSSITRCAEILKQRIDINSITICSDRYHVPRCRWLFHLLGVPTRFGLMPSGWKANGSIRWGYYYVRELIAIPVDTFILMVRWIISPKAFTKGYAFL